MKQPAVYIIASSKNGTLYIGATSNLPKRIYEHREGIVDGFTKKYGCKTLVWYEQHPTMESAIRKEKRLKKYSRQWKINLIEEMNPRWLDLWDDVKEPI